MPEYSCQRSGNSSRTNKIVRSPCLNNSGSLASSEEFSIYSETTNKRTESSSILSSDLYISTAILRSNVSGISKISRFPDFQVVLPGSASKCFDNKDGCIQERLGSSLSRNSSKKGMVFTGTITSYESNGNEGSNALLAYHKQF